MKSVLINMKPQDVKWVQDGEKTIVIRNSKPKFNFPFKCFVCCCNILVGEFVCNRIEKYGAKFTDDCDDCFETIGRLIPTEDTEDDESEYHYEFVTSNKCENIDDCDLCRESHWSYNTIRNYLFNKNDNLYIFYSWHISNFKLYNIQKNINEFEILDGNYSYMFDIFHPIIHHEPISWMYCEMQEMDYMNLLFNGMKKKVSELLSFMELNDLNSTEFEFEKINKKNEVIDEIVSSISCYLEYFDYGVSEYDIKTYKKSFDALYDHAVKQIKDFQLSEKYKRYKSESIKLHDKFNLNLELPTPIYNFNFLVMVMVIQIIHNKEQ